MDNQNKFMTDKFVEGEVETVVNEIMNRKINAYLKESIGNQLTKYSTLQILEDIKESIDYKMSELRRELDNDK